VSGLRLKISWATKPQMLARCPIRERGEAGDFSVGWAVVGSSRAAVAADEGEDATIRR
jgi:hypothetical protein